MALTPGLEPRNRFRDHSLADCRLTIRLISAFGTRTRSRTSLCWFRANRATDIPYGCIGAHRQESNLHVFLWGRLPDFQSGAPPPSNCNICNGAAHRIRTCKSLLTKCLQNTVLTARSCSVSGAHSQDRTDYLILTMDALCRLSYASIWRQTEVTTSIPCGTTRFRDGDQQPAGIIWHSCFWRPLRESNPPLRCQSPLFCR